MKKPPDISAKHFALIEMRALAVHLDEDERAEAVRKQVEALRALVHGRPSDIARDDYDDIVGALMALFGADFHACRRYAEVALELHRVGIRLGSDADEPVLERPADISRDEFVLADALAAVRYHGDPVGRAEHLRRHLSALRVFRRGAPRGVDEARYTLIDTMLDVVFGADFARRLDFNEIWVDLLHASTADDQAARAVDEAVRAVLDYQRILAGSRSGGPERVDRRAPVPSECPTCGAPVPLSSASGPVVCVYCNTRLSDVEACPDPDAHEDEPAPRPRYVPSRHAVDEHDRARTLGWWGLVALLAAIGVGVCIVVVRGAEPRPTASSAPAAPEPEDTRDVAEAAPPPPTVDPCVELRARPRPRHARGYLEPQVVVGGRFVTPRAGDRPSLVGMTSLPHETLLYVEWTHAGRVVWTEYAGVFDGCFQTQLTQPAPALASGETTVSIALHARQTPEAQRRLTAASRRLLPQVLRIEASSSL